MGRPAKKDNITKRIPTPVIPITPPSLLAIPVITKTIQPLDIDWKREFARLKAYYPHQCIPYNKELFRLLYMVKKTKKNQETTEELQQALRQVCHSNCRPCQIFRRQCLLRC